MQHVQYLAAEKAIHRVRLLRNDVSASVESGLVTLTCTFQCATTKRPVIQTKTSFALTAVESSPLEQLPEELPTPPKEPQEVISVMRSGNKRRSMKPKLGQERMHTVIRQKLESADCNKVHSSFKQLLRWLGWSADQSKDTMRLMKDAGYVQRVGRSRWRLVSSVFLGKKCG